MRRGSRAAPVLAAAMAALLLLGPPPARGVGPEPAGGTPPAETRSAEEAWSLGRELAERDQHEAALAVIADALADHPDDVDLLWLRAGVTGWAGRHHESVTLFEELVARHPEMADAVRLDLATERLESGDAAGALRDLDLYLAEHPADRDARRLLDQALGRSRPGMNASYERSDDSDGQRILSSTLEYLHPVKQRDVLILMLRQDESSDPGGFREAFRLGAGHERVWSNRWSSRLVVLHLNPGPGRAKTGVGEAAVTYEPSRRLRVDLGIEREPILTRQALELEILMWTVVAGMDWRPSSRFALHLARRQHDYSDDNEAFRHTAAVYVPLVERDRVRWTAAFQVEQLNSAREPDHGYYSPDRYWEYGPGMEFEWQPADPWMVGLDVRTGRQVENDLDHDPFASVAASARLPIGRFLVLGLGAFHSDSSLRSVSGFEGTGWSIHLGTRF